MRIKQDNTCNAFRRIPGVQEVNAKCCRSLFTVSADTKSITVIKWILKNF